METVHDIKAAHPCFDKEARHSHARVHLPVAPACNIQCNYCNRKYDCVNESRPGVTSSVLNPRQAVEYLKELDSRLENLSVIGIAGPGDPFANPEETLATMRQSKAQFPEKIFCISTNGLELEPYIDELAELGVSHVTITINAVDPAITAGVYKWVRFRKRIYRGEEGVRILMEQQLKCIPLLKAKGITVKINSIIIPGVNENHIPEVAKTCAALGADVINCIPLIPTKDTAYEDLKEPDSKMIFKTRTMAGEFIPIMSHCARCRADAAGLLGKDLSETHVLLKEYSERTFAETEGRPYVAVGTFEGMLVNQHLGEASSLYIFKQSPKGYKFVEERATPPAGSGNDRWLQLAESLSDCRAILVSGIGPTPKKILSEKKLHVVEMTGLIDEGLDGVYNNKVIRSMAKPDAFKCGSVCKGNAQGCG
ncbi:MAG: nitrogenase cofactor biosynthesis protein NifB [Paludibacter sp.]|jgi:nitrogen fixation protein NifB|nr:nitrogenase cofactor biosynthesis protein NifB [Paludibacter sp.]